MKRKARAAAFLLVVLALTGACGGAPQAPALTPLHHLDDLRERFNGDAGAPRLILLLSPT